MQFQEQKTLQRRISPTRPFKPEPVPPFYVGPALSNWTANHQDEGYDRVTLRLAQTQTGELKFLQTTKRMPGSETAGTKEELISLQEGLEAMVAQGQLSLVEKLPITDPLDALTDPDDLNSPDFDPWK